MGARFRLDGGGDDVGIGHRHLSHRGIGDTEDIVSMVVHVGKVSRDGAVSRRHGRPIDDWEVQKDTGSRRSFQLPELVKLGSWQSLTMALGWMAGRGLSTLWEMMDPYVESYMVSPSTIMWTLITAQARWGSGSRGVRQRGAGDYSYFRES